MNTKETEQTKDGHRISLGERLFAIAAFLVMLASLCIGAWHLGCWVSSMVHHVYLFIAHHLNPRA
jgi:hypothetical protein